MKPLVYFSNIRKNHTLFSLPRDIISCIVNFLNVKEIILLDSAVTNAYDREKWLDTLKIIDPIFFNNLFYNNKSFEWIIKRNIQLTSLQLNIWKLKITDNSLTFIGRNLKRLKYINMSCFTDIPIYYPKFVLIVS